MKILNGDALLFEENLHNKKDIEILSDDSTSPPYSPSSDESTTLNNDDTETKFQYESLPEYSIKVDDLPEWKKSLIKLSETKLQFDENFDKSQSDYKRDPCLTFVIYGIENQLLIALEDIVTLSKKYKYEILHVDTRIHHPELTEKFSATSPKTPTNGCHINFSLKSKIELDILAKIRFTLRDRRLISIVTEHLKEKYEGKIKFLNLNAQQHGYNSSNAKLKMLEKGIDHQILETDEMDEKSCDKDIYIPTHISHLDMCNHILIKFEPELHCSHPGYLDKEYRNRRSNIVQIAFNYKFHDGPIQKVDYIPEEVKTWGIIYKMCKEQHKLYACLEYNEIFAQLEEEGIFHPERMPQLEELSQFLKRKSGFQLRPAAGLLTARDFLASLAFRVFQATQYMRHTSSPLHTPEPDVIHEVLGHIPMLADPDFAQLSQEIGLASLGASDEEIVKLSTLYWFTVEFGLCKEDGMIKAYGAGLMSSFGELEHALSSKPKLIAFEPEKAAIQPYQDETYQDVYFVTESFKDAKEQLLKYTMESLKRTYQITYNPYTQSIQYLNTLDDIKKHSEKATFIMKEVSQALQKIQM